MPCSLQVDESHLTGESEDVIKDAVRTPIILSGSKVCLRRASYMAVN